MFRELTGTEERTKLWIYIAVINVEEIVCGHSGLYPRLYFDVGVQGFRKRHSPILSVDEFLRDLSSTSRLHFFLLDTLPTIKEASSEVRLWQSSFDLFSLNCFLLLQKCAIREPRYS